MRAILLLCLISFSSLAAANSYLDQSAAEIMQSANDQNQQLKSDYARSREEAARDAMRLQQLTRGRQRLEEIAPPAIIEPPESPPVQTLLAPIVQTPPVSSVLPQAPEPVSPPTTANIYR